MSFLKISNLIFAFTCFSNIAFTQEFDDIRLTPLNVELMANQMNLDEQKTEEQQAIKLFQFSDNKSLTKCLKSKISSSWVEEKGLFKYIADRFAHQELYPEGIMIRTMLDLEDHSIASTLSDNTKLLLARNFIAALKQCACDASDSLIQSEQQENLLREEELNTSG